MTIWMMGIWKTESTMWTPNITGTGRGGGRHSTSLPLVMINISICRHKYTTQIRIRVQDPHSEMAMSPYINESTQLSTCSMMNVVDSRRSFTSDLSKPSETCNFSSSSLLNAFSLGTAVCIAWVIRLRRSGNFDASKLFIISTALFKLKVKSNIDKRRQIIVAKYYSRISLIWKLLLWKFWCAGS